MAEHGMITPNTLFFVRSHGIVPTLSFFDHSITIEGLVTESAGAHTYYSSRQVQKTR